MSARARTGQVRSGKYRDHYRKYMQGRCQEMRQRINNLKNKPCTDCGISYPPYVMDFDHVRGEKKYHVGHLAHSSKSWETILTEIAKCDLVCANCHRIRTYGSGKQVIRKRVEGDIKRPKQIPTCHPDRKYAGRGMCIACYKRSRRGPKYCLVCNIELPLFKAKTCGPKCFHSRQMELQRLRRASQ